MNGGFVLHFTHKTTDPVKRLRHLPISIPHGFKIRLLFNLLANWLDICFKLRNHLSVKFTLELRLLFLDLFDVVRLFILCHNAVEVNESLLYLFYDVLACFVKLLMVKIFKEILEKSFTYFVYSSKLLVLPPLVATLVILFLAWALILATLPVLALSLKTIIARFNHSTL